MKETPEISLTDFVDFVAKSGTPKFTHVKTIKRRGDYSPAEDFWRRLRQEIIDFHCKGYTTKSMLDSALLELTDKKKQNNYPTALAAYKKFLGRKEITWFDPDHTRWKHGDLVVRVNPELGLIINGRRHHLKLYFKGQPITKNKADLILLLLKMTLRNTQEGDTFSILDVQQAKLHSSSTPDDDILPLIEGEALAFSQIWRGIKK